MWESLLLPGEKKIHEVSGVAVVIHRRRFLTGNILVTNIRTLFKSTENKTAVKNLYFKFIHRILDKYEEIEIPHYSIYKIIEYNWLVSKNILNEQQKMASDFIIIRCINSRKLIFNFKEVDKNEKNNLFSILLNITPVSLSQTKNATPKPYKKIISNIKNLFRPSQASMESHFSTLDISDSFNSNT